MKEHQEETKWRQKTNKQTNKQKKTIQSDSVPAS
jgi:hypothetical protein